MPPYKFNVPSKSERDDGGSNEIGIGGLVFGLLIYALFIYVIIDSIF